MLRRIIEKLILKKDLAADEVGLAVNEILNDAPPEQVAAFLVLLHSKGETAEELQGLADALHEQMTPVATDYPVLDIVGTGGDNANTVNISTASSLLAAACGAKVVKHGNRSVSSKCGSADLLEAFGMVLDKKPEQILEDLRRHGFAFCFAPSFHPSMKRIKSVRKALGVRTSFNLIGPLLNPANAQHILLGVFSLEYLDLFADTLIRLGVKHAMVVHSCGLDELTLIGPAEVIEIRDGKKERKQLEPLDYGFSRTELKAIQGNEPEDNKRLIENALNGEPGPIADTIIFNTGVALYVADIVGSIEEGLVFAREKIQSGEALKVLG